jgi:RNA recognition motif-containing protein
MGMSLDAIMDANKSNEQRASKQRPAHQKAAGGKARTNNKEQRRAVPYLDRTVDDRKPQVRPLSAGNGGGANIFSRLGGGGPAPGCTVSFKNLSYSVSENDLMELCKAVGKVVSITTSKGHAEVVFSNGQVANLCCSKYNGLSLDGRTMTVEVKPQDAPISVFSRMQGAPANVREGMFGTAIGGGSGNAGGFKINLGGGIVKPTGQSFVSGGGGRSVAMSFPTNVRAPQQIHQQQHQQQQHQQRQQKAPREQQRGNKQQQQGGRGAGKPARAPKVVKPEDLDAEMDAYMGKTAENVSKDKAKSLDDDMDAYFAARKAPATVAAAAI